MQKGDLFIHRRDNGLPDQLLVVHYCTASGIVFCLWNDGHKPGQGHFMRLTEMPFDDFAELASQGRITQFVLLN